HYKQGRVFLVGDAAHTVLPSGGLGAGTGIQDTFNLAWKLALVLSGKAGASLLDTYEEERLPIGQLTVEQTLLRYFYRTGAEGMKFIDDPEMALGYRYHSQAIISEPGASEAPLTQPLETLHGEPGTRAPHLVLEREGVQISSIDLCGGKWTLLVGPQGTVWDEVVRRVAEEFDLTLSVYSISGEKGWKDVEERWNSLYGVSTTGAVLVRPDGFVAWRLYGYTNDAQEQLMQAIARILAREA
ncbi:MAG TPA: FAD-dependent monooxygenase, partial [Ktedonobacteraceae bacterium]|nr:FAD-dependent monooxygenase [Ktedonobacteraceae bacterium]